MQTLKWTIDNPSQGNNLYALDYQGTDPVLFTHSKSRTFFEAGIERLQCCVAPQRVAQRRSTVVHYLIVCGVHTTYTHTQSALTKHTTTATARTWKREPLQDGVAAQRVA